MFMSGLGLANDVLVSRQKASPSKIGQTAVALLDIAGAINKADYSMHVRHVCRQSGPATIRYATLTFQSCATWRAGQICIKADNKGFALGHDCIVLPN